MLVLAYRQRVKILADFGLRLLQRQPVIRIKVSVEVAYQLDVLFRRLLVGILLRRIDGPINVAPIVIVEPIKHVSFITGIERPRDRRLLLFWINRSQLPWPKRQSHLEIGN